VEMVIIALIFPAFEFVWKFTAALGRLVLVCSSHYSRQTPSGRDLFSLNQLNWIAWHRLSLLDYPLRQEDGKSP